MSLAARCPPLDAALGLGAALVAGGVLPYAPLEVATACAVVAGHAWRRRRIGAGWLLLATLGLGLGALRASAAVTRHERARREADAALGLPKRCTAVALVTSSPVEVRGSLRWDGELDHVVCEDLPTAWRGPATLYGGPPGLARGDRVEVVATLGAPQRLWNEATGDPRPGEAHRGVLRSGGTLDVRVLRAGRGLGAMVDRVRARVRARIEATFAPDVAPMVRALVLGESDLSPADDQAFRVAGLSHLLAVSGMHLVLVLALIVKVLEGALVRVESIAARVDVGRIGAGLGVVAAWLYAELAGAGGSTLRAAWMATCVLLARALGRRGDTKRAFGLSLAAMAAVDPLVAYDLSFALSGAATAGLLAFARPMAEAFVAKLPARLAPIARAAATTAAATVPCTPLIARFAPTVPLGGIVANLVAVPIGESAALPLCLLQVLLGAWPAAERGCAAAATGALVLVRWVARLFASPALSMEVPCPTSWQLAVAAAALTLLVLGAPRGPLAGVASLVLLGLELAARRAGAPHGVLRATFLDVGQGDAAVIDLPDGQAMVIDGGGLVGSPVDVGVRVLAPELRARRRKALAAVVLSHPHPDHFTGLASGLDAASFTTLWETGEGEAEETGGGYAVLLAHARAVGATIVRPPLLCGVHALGGATIEVLSPCPRFDPDLTPNDNSIVLRVSYGRRSMLFVGDAEHATEGALLRSAAGDLRADVLKVGHHGSRTSSTPGFLAAVGASEAIVSVGCRNRFGHPNAATLAALEAAGARVWRTDRDGAVTVETDGETLRVRAVTPPDDPR